MQKFLEDIVEPLYTAEAVLTEVLQVLDHSSQGADALKAFFMGEYVNLVAPNKEDVERAFARMDRYRGLPMDFSAATLLVVCENLNTDKVFTLDFNGF